MRQLLFCIEETKAYGGSVCSSGGCKFEKIKVWGRGCVCTGMHTRMEARHKPLCHHSGAFQFVIFLSQDLTLALGSLFKSRLIGQWTLKIHSTPCWDYRCVPPFLAFHMGRFWGSSSDLHACTTSTLVTPPSLHTQKTKSKANYSAASLFYFCRVIWSRCASAYSWEDAELGGRVAGVDHAWSWDVHLQWDMALDLVQSC